MATIELSSDFFTGSTNSATYRVLFPSANDGNLASAIASGMLQGGLTTGYPMTTISLMKGSIPTDFSITTVSTRSADILCTWQNVYGSGGNGLQMTTSGYTPYVITSSYVAASASGTATWFWWLSRPGSSPNVPGNTITHQIYGTVGVSGSGADLELPSVDIVSGNNYRFINLRVNFAGPTFTY